MTWAAAASFVAAWFLPVASDVPGWMAFRYAMAPMWPYGPNGADSHMEDAAPHILSALTNVVFVVLFAQLVADKVTRPALWLRVAIACVALDLYWLVQAIRDGQSNQLRIGYYVWLAAFAMLMLIGWRLVRIPKPD